MNNIEEVITMPIRHNRGLPIFQCFCRGEINEQVTMIIAAKDFDEVIQFLEDGTLTPITIVQVSAASSFGVTHVLCLDGM